MPNFKVSIIPAGDGPATAGALVLDRLVPQLLADLPHRDPFAAARSRVASAAWLTGRSESTTRCWWY